MLYLLDTNIVSYLMENYPNVMDNFALCLNAGNTIKIPDIVYYEVQRGLFYNNSKKYQTVFDDFCNLLGIQEISLPAFFRAAKLYADLKTKGTPIEDSDLLIATIALENDATLITNNTKHMNRIPTLPIQDWSAKIFTF